MEHSAPAITGHTVLRSNTSVRNINILPVLGWGRRGGVEVQWQRVTLGRSGHLGAGGVSCQTHSRLCLREVIQQEAVWRFHHFNAIHHVWREGTMKNLIAFLSSQRDVGYLIMRVMGGGVIFWAGWLKMFGPGFSGIGDGFAKMGIALPQVAGPFILLLEFGGGAAVILGLFTRYLGVLFTIEFIVALLAVKLGAGYGAFRIDLMLIAFGVLIATHGAGRYSLDKKLNLGD